MNEYTEEEETPIMSYFQKQKCPDHAYSSIDQTELYLSFLKMVQARMVDPPKQ
jgi:hypothetical protein